MRAPDDVRTTDRRLGRLRRMRALAFLTAILVAAGAAHAVTHLKYGMQAPAFSLPDLDGSQSDVAAFEGRPVILLFGELYHEKTLQACRDVQAVLDALDAGDHSPAAILIVARDEPAQTLRATAVDAGVIATVLRDPRRQAFGDYQVAVMPSTVIIDPTGAVVHAIAGVPPGFREIMRDGLLLSMGRMTREQFDVTLHPEVHEVPENVVRAARIAQLARQLARRSLHDLAEEKYREALQLAPDYVPAMLGRGFLRLHRGRLAEAEDSFRRVLAIEPGDVEASLGLAAVHAQRGGEELSDAERMLQELLRQTPSEPRAHYLLGSVYQSRGEPEEAALHFREAAELLMRTDHESWEFNPGGQRDVQQPVP